MVNGGSPENKASRSSLWSTIFQVVSRHNRAGTPQLAWVRDARVLGPAYGGSRSICLKGAGAESSASCWWEPPV